MPKTQDVFLAIDQGTHSSRAILYDAKCQPLAKHQVDVSLNRIDDIRVEQDGCELLQSVQDCIGSVQETASKNDWTIKAAGLATQRSSVVAWDRKTGQAISPVLSWQDRRAHEDVELLRDVAPLIRKYTGLPLTPHYGASKIRWLLQEYLPNQTSAKQASVKTANVGVGPLASFLVANMIDGKPYVVDHTNALRTQLMNLQRLDWEPWLVEAFGLNGVQLPKCMPVVSDFGKLDGTEIRLGAVSGDQTAAMFSQGAFPSETALVNLGTGGFVLKPREASAESDRELLGGLSISDGEHTRYLTEGTVNGCGAAIAWAAEQLGFNGEIDDQLDGWLDQVSHPPLFLNTVGGLGSPYWMSSPTPRWCNLAREPISQPDAVSAMVAVLESIVFLIYENFRRITRHEPIRDLRISGGLSNVEGICHRIANLTQCRVTRTRHAEATSAGVAWMAAGRPEKWTEPGEDTIFVPGQDDDLRKRYESFTAMLEHFRPQKT